MNAEGYKDPTAERACAEADRAPDDVVALVHLMRSLAALHGYELEGWVWLKDKKTGREWR